jgi:hypothetical protein
MNVINYINTTTSLIYFLFNPNVIWKLGRQVCSQIGSEGKVCVCLYVWVNCYLFIIIDNYILLVGFIQIITLLSACNTGQWLWSSLERMVNKICKIYYSFSHTSLNFSQETRPLLDWDQDKLLMGKGTSDSDLFAVWWIKWKKRVLQFCVTGLRNKNCQFFSLIYPNLSAVHITGDLLLLTITLSSMRYVSWDVNGPTYNSPSNDSRSTSTGKHI